MNNTVFCTNCGTSNASNTKFCTGCGSQLPVQENMNQGVVAPVQPVNQQQQNVVQNNVTQQSKAGSMNYFKYLLNVFLKPHTEFKNQESNLTNFKHSALLSVILIGTATIINLFISMFNAVRYKNLWTGEVTWVWENLKHVEYFKVIGQNLLTYTLVIFVLAGIYFLAALVMKKDSNFSKILGASVTAFLPIMISTIILTPLLSMIHTLVGLIVGIVGVVYGIVIFIELMNDIVVIENKNHKIYYHMSCLSIYLTIGVIAVYLMLSSSLNSLGSALSVLG